MGSGFGNFRAPSVGGLPWRGPPRTCPVHTRLIPLDSSRRARQHGPVKLVNPVLGGPLTHWNSPQSAQEGPANPSPTGHPVSPKVSPRVWDH